MQYLLLLLIIIIIPLAIFAFKVLWIANDIEKRVTNKGLFNHSLIKKSLMKNSLLKKVVGFILTVLAGVFGHEYSAEMFYTLSALTLVVYSAVEFVKSATNWKPQFYTVLVFLFSVLLSFAGWFLGLGLFAETTLALPFIIALFSGLAAIGIFETEWLEALLALFWPYFERQQEVKQRKLEVLEKNANYIWGKKAA